MHTRLRTYCEVRYIEPDNVGAFTPSEQFVWSRYGVSVKPVA